MNACREESKTPENNRSLAPVQTKTITKAREAYWVFKLLKGITSIPAHLYLSFLPSGVNIAFKTCNGTVYVIFVFVISMMMDYISAETLISISRNFTVEKKATFFHFISFVAETHKKSTVASSEGKKIAQILTCRCMK